MNITLPYDEFYIAKKESKTERPDLKLKFKDISKYVKYKLKAPMCLFLRNFGNVNKENIHVPVLPFPLSQFDYVLLTTDKPISQVYVNGNKVSFRNPSAQIKIDRALLEPWENIVLTDSYCSIHLWPKTFKTSSIKILAPGTYYIVPTKTNPASITQKELTEYEHNVECQSPPKFSSHRAVAIQYLINSYNNVKSSNFKGTFFACYDYESKCYRLISWIWCTGVVIKALLSEWNRTGNSKYKDLAIRAGNILLQHQDRDGGFVVRWDLGGKSGVKKWKAPNDSAIIGAYGLMPLYKATGNKRFLSASIDIGNWIITKGLRPNGHLSVGYLDNWVYSWLYIDSGFTANLFYEIYQERPNDRWKIACEKFINWFIDNFRKESGLFIKTWRENGNHDIIFYSRGQAWALDGFVSAYKLLKHKNTLSVACDIANNMVRHQNKDGSWDYIGDDPYSGKDNKGTPVIAYNLLQLYELIPKNDYLASAVKAIHWCEINQDMNDGIGYGGIKSWNKEGCIVGKRSTTNAFAYGDAFYILAKNMYESLHIEKRA